MDCSLPGSSVHGICQARVLEWDAIAFSQYLVHEIARVGHYLVTKPNQADLCILSPSCTPFTDSSLSERPQQPSIKAQEGSSPGANQHLYVIPLEVAISCLWMMKRVPVNILLQAPLSVEF